MCIYSCVCIQALREESCEPTTTTTRMHSTNVNALRQRRRQRHGGFARHTHETAQFMLWCCGVGYGLGWVAATHTKTQHKKNTFPHYRCSAHHRKPSPPCILSGRSRHARQRRTCTRNTRTHTRGWLGRSRSIAPIQFVHFGIRIKARTMYDVVYFVCVCVSDGVYFVHANGAKLKRFHL